MKGVLDEMETNTCDTLKEERDKLLNKLKIEVSFKETIFLEDRKIELVCISFFM